MATGTFCGTGAWANAPKPGDPDGEVTLTATPAFGGIDVEWTYPGINPQAVAFVRLYRSTNLEDTSPALHKITQGTFFYDKTTTATPVEYAYWVELVSINGTVGDRIGPAVATARPTIQQVIEGLTAQIDNGMLAQSLKEDIGRIETNKLEIDQALIDQAAVDDSLAVAFTELQAHGDDTRALVQEETVARTEADSAFVAQVNTLAADLGDEITAAVQQESEARVSGDQAIASQLNTVESELEGNLAQVQTGLQTNIETTNDRITEIGALYTAQVNVNGLIGGFGVHNDGSTVEAGFDVDRFWVGRTNANKRKPFIIEDDEVFMDEAVIRSLTFNKLRADDGGLLFEDGVLRADYLDVQEAARFTGDVSSNNYRSGTSGWALFQNGYAEFNEATIRGNLEVQSITVNGYSPLGGELLSVSSFNTSGSGSIGGTSSWRTHISHSVSRSSTVSFPEVPKNAKLRFTLTRDGTVSISGEETYKNGRRRVSGTDGSGPTYVTNYDHYEHRDSYARLRVRVLVDGSTVYDQSVSSNRNGPSYGGFTRTVSNLDNVAFDYTYPSYRSISYIEVIVTAYVKVRSRKHNLKVNTTTKAGDYSMRVFTDQGTVQLSRLG